MWPLSPLSQRETVYMVTLSIVRERERVSVYVCEYVCFNLLFSPDTFFRNKDLEFNLSYFQQGHPTSLVPSEVPPPS